MSQKQYGDRIIECKRRKDYPGALALVEEALTVYPTHPFFLQNEVAILYSMGRIKEAREKAERRLAVLKGDPYFLRSYLLILEKEKEKEKAQDDMIRLIERTIFADRVGDEAFYGFLSRLAGRVFSREKALDILKRAMTLFPESAALKGLLDAWHMEGGTRGRYHSYKEKFSGRPVREAISEIENIRLLPGYAEDVDLHRTLAELYKKAKLYDKAVECYRLVLSLKEDPFTRKMLGYLYYKMGELDSALVYLKEAFFQDPYDHYLYGAVSKIFQKRADYEGFERLVNEGLGLNPDAKHLHGLLKRAQRWKKD